MSTIRITSVSAPLDRPNVLAPALGLVRRAQGLGLLSAGDPIDRLDMDLVRTIAQEASAAGVGQDAAAALLQPGTRTPARLADLIGRLDDALVASPMPEREIRALVRIYDYDGLASLVGASVASLRRYAAGTRSVPDAVAGRIHFVALVTSDLAGSYNEFGLRRWWERPRTPLDGRSPRVALWPSWDPGGPTAAAVTSLAASLAGDGAAGLAGDEAASRHGLTTVA